MSFRPFREELKFLVSHDVKQLLLARWQRYLARAPFTNERALSPVLSLYYDSPDLRFYREKIEGFPSRQKVRMRTYAHAFTAGQTTILEIKYRENDLVRKLRYAISGFDPSRLAPERWGIDDPEVRGVFETLRERYRLRPTAQVYYQREAYEGLVERDVRVTIDTSLLGLHPGERPTRKLLLDRSRSLMPDTVAILEVKATRGIPPWVHEGIVAVELQQKTIPKYVTAVESLGLPQLTEAGIYA
jgi:hypothetical protein